MFKKSSVYFHKATASGIFNNLIGYTDSDKIICGIAHKSNIEMLMGPETTNLTHRKIILENIDNKQNEDVVSINLIKCSDAMFLGALKEDLFYFYESDGSAQLSVITNKSINCSTSFTCFSSINNFVIIGTDDGSMKLLEISLSNRKLKPSDCCQTIDAHDSSIVCMHADTKIFVSADENYCVKSWSFSDSSKLNLISKYTPMKAGSVNEPINVNQSQTCSPTVIYVIPKTRVCAIGDTQGRLSLINCETGRLLVQANAHSRLISGLAHSVTDNNKVSSGRFDLLISVSEDTLCRIWNVGLAGSVDKDGDKPAASISLLQTILIPDQMIQGVTFTNRKNLEFLISCYDSNETVSFVHV